MSYFFIITLIKTNRICGTWKERLIQYLIVIIKWTFITRLSDKTASWAQLIFQFRRLCQNRVVNVDVLELSSWVHMSNLTAVFNCTYKFLAVYKSITSKVNALPSECDSFGEVFSRYCIAWKSAQTWSITLNINHF